MSYLNIEPSLTDVETAVMIGYDEATVLQQVLYWINLNKRKGNNYINGRYWVYNSVVEWQQNNFPFWSVDKVKRILKKLIDLNLLIVGNFNKDKRDRTKWYTPNYEELKKLDDNKMTNAKYLKALVQNPQLQKRTMPQPLPESTTENTNTEKIYNSVSQSNTISNSEKSKPKEEPKPKEKPKDDGQTESYSLSFVRKKFCISELEKESQMYTEIAELIYDVLNGYTKIKDKPQQITISRFMKLTPAHLQFVVEQINEVNTPIRCMNSYLLVALYNSFVSLDAHTTNQVNNALYGNLVKVYDDDGEYEYMTEEEAEKYE